MEAIANKLRVIAGGKIVIPNTLNGALRLIEELDQLAVSNPEMYKKLECRDPYTNPSALNLHVEGTNPNFDFSNFEMDGIKVKLIRVGVKSLFVDAKLGSYSSHLYFRSNSTSARFFPTGRFHIPEVDKVQTYALSTLTRLGNKFKSAYGIQDRGQVLSAIEGLWQEGYQFDGYLPGSATPADVSSIVDIMNVGPKVEAKAMNEFRNYWIAHAVVTSLKELQGYFNDVISKYEEFVDLFVEFARVFDGVSECGNNLECLYRIFSA